MDSNAVWIIVAVVAVLIVLGVLLFAGRKRQQTRLHNEAQDIRDQVQQETVQVDRRAALADETAARARAAQAEAEAKAAEAARLADRADAHRNAAETSRYELDERQRHADSIDPRVKADDRTNTDPNMPIEQPR